MTDIPSVLQDAADALREHGDLLSAYQAHQHILYGSGNPNGVVTAGQGTLYWDYTNNVLYANDTTAVPASSSWTAIGPGVALAGRVDINIAGGFVDRSGNTILRFDVGLALLSEYPATNAGYAAAIAAAAAGDEIWLPKSLVLTASHTVPAGVIVQGPCNLTLQAAQTVEGTLRQVNITASGAYGNLVAVGQFGILEHLDIAYTTTTNWGASVYVGDKGCEKITDVRAVTTCTTAGLGTYGLHMVGLRDGCRVENCYFEASGNAANAQRYGVSVDGVAAPKRLLIANVIGYATCSAASPTCYGIRCVGGEERTLLTGCIGIAHPNWVDGTGYGIYAANCTVTGCLGRADGGGAGGGSCSGIYCSGDAFGCYGIANWSQTTRGMHVVYDGAIHACYGQATGLTVNGYGIFCTGLRTRIIASRGEGFSYDLYGNDGTVHVRSTSYRNVGGAATFVWVLGDPLIGDLVTYNLNLAGTDYNTLVELNEIGIRLSYNITSATGDTPFPDILYATVPAGGVGNGWQHSAGNGWQPFSNVDGQGPGILIPLDRPDNWELSLNLDLTGSAVDEEYTLYAGYIANSNHIGATAIVDDSAAAAVRYQANLETNDGDDTYTNRYAGANLDGAAVRTVKFRCKNGCVSVWDDQDNLWHDYTGRQSAGHAYTAAHVFIQVIKHADAALAVMYLSELVLTYLA